jgi:hypothetical protein
MSEKKTTKKAAKRKVEFGSTTKERQWNKPQAAAKEMLLAIGKLAKDVEAAGGKLDAVSVKMDVLLNVAGSDFSGVVTEK